MAVKTIRVRSRGNDLEVELPSDTTDIRPGDLLKVGAAGKVIPNNQAADVDPEVIVAMENPDIGNGIEVSYTATDESVRCWWPEGGDVFYGFLKTANNAAIGASLEMGGAGNLQLLSTGKLVAIAVEAVNNASGVDQRIKARKV